MASSKLKRIITVTGWLTLSAGVLVLLVAAMGRREDQLCKRVEVEIEGEGQTLFVERKDILNTLTANGGRSIKGKPVGSISIKDLEAQLEKNVWISNAELFFDKDAVLQVRITENEPVARVFSINGNSWYMDSAGARLPLSDQFSARLPVFTGFPTDRKNLGKEDSALLQRMKELSLFLKKNPFWMAQSGEIAITSSRQLEMHPVFGSHVVELGDGKELENRFTRLELFYRQVLKQTGPNAWSRIKVQFANQVVAIRNGMEEKTVLVNTPVATPVTASVNNSTAQAVNSTPAGGPAPRAVMPPKRRNNN